MGRPRRQVTTIGTIMHSTLGILGEVTVTLDQELLYPRRLEIEEAVNGAINVAAPMCQIVHWRNGLVGELRELRDERHEG